MVTGALGAGGGIAGLTLVFLGIIIAAYQSYPPATQDDVLTGHKRAIGGALAAFLVGLATTSLSLIWLTTDGGGGPLYTAILATFFVELAAILGVAAYTTRVILR